MPSAVTAIALLATMPTLVYCSQLHGAAGGNSTEGSSKSITLATWNVLSVSKCDLGANGFVSMEEAAFTYHNSGCPEPKEGLVCTSKWIQDEIPRLFKEFDIDAMFLQEIDWPLLQGLESLNKKFKHMPISGQHAFMEAKAEAQSVRQWLEDSKKKEKGKPASDFAYVVWDATKVQVNKCRQVGKDTIDEKGKVTLDMSKVGLCEIQLNGCFGAGATFHVLGMHADGDKGFDVEQANLITSLHPKIQIDAVLGDVNRHEAGDVGKAVSALNPHLVLPEGDQTGDKKTVYRVVHKYRKLVQAVMNSKIMRTGEGQDDSCGAGSTPAYEKLTKLCDDIAKVRGGTGTGKKFETFLTLKKEDSELWDAVSQTNYPWKKFAGQIGLDDDFKVKDLTTAKSLMISEVKREDWVAYDEKKFKKVPANSGKESATFSIVAHEADLREASEYKDGSASNEKKYPIKAMASDHLPVIMKLHINGDTGKSRVRSYRPVNRLVKKILRTLIDRVSAKS